MERAEMLIFDGDCGFCTACARWLKGVLIRLGRRRVQVVPWQHCDLIALGIDPQRVRDEVVWIGPAHEQSGGADALADCLGLRFQRWPLIRGASRLAYRLVARNRHRLPGTTPACASGRPT